jgi:hypothetical protein
VPENQRQRSALINYSDPPSCCPLLTNAGLPAVDVSTRTVLHRSLHYECWFTENGCISDQLCARKLTSSRHSDKFMHMSGTGAHTSDVSTMNLKQFEI